MLSLWRIVLALVLLIVPAALDAEDLVTAPDELTDHKNPTEPWVPRLMITVNSGHSPQRINASRLEAPPTPYLPTYSSGSADTIGFAGRHSETIPTENSRVSASPWLRIECDQVSIQAHTASENQIAYEFTSTGKARIVTASGTIITTNDLQLKDNQLRFKNVHILTADTVLEATAMTLNVRVEQLDVKPFAEAQSSPALPTAVPYFSDPSASALAPAKAPGKPTNPAGKVSQPNF